MAGSGVARRTCQAHRLLEGSGLRAGGPVGHGQTQSYDYSGFRLDHVHGNAGEALQTAVISQRLFDGINDWSGIQVDTH